MPEKNEFLRAALYYAKYLHWRVFPVAEGKKAPAKFKDFPALASTDPQQITKWWKKWPRANVAVLTGEKLFVIDIDFRHGGLDTVEQLFHQHGKLRDTLRQLTGRQDSSYQLFYQHPPGEPLTGTENACGWEGIDTRGFHNYVLLPPSIHPDTKKEYVWDGVKRPHETVIEPMDDWLIKALRDSQNGHRPNGEHFTIEEGKIPHGQQKHRLFRLGCSLRQAGGQYPEIVEAMLAFLHNRCSVIEKNAEENTIKEAKDICQRYPAGKRIDISPGLPFEPWPTVEPPPETEREHATGVYDANVPDPEPIIEPILYPGLTILGGRPKAGKSWLALQLGIAVVNQLKLGGYLQVQKKLKVLYVSLEDRRAQLKKRLRHLVVDKSYLEGLDLIYDIAPLMAGGAAQIDQTLTKEPVGVLIVDSLLAAVKAAGRKNMDIMQTDYNIIGTLREIATKHAIAVIVVAHTRKMGGDFLDLIQGTSGTTAAADAVWVLQRTPDNKASLSVTGREVPANTFGLEHSHDSAAWIITGEGDAVIQSDARQDILQLLKDKDAPARNRDGTIKKPQGMKPSQIAKELHKNISGINRLLAALVELGLVKKIGYGSYTLPGENEPPEAYE